MNDQKKTLFRTAIDAMSGYEPGEQPQDRQYIKLNTNENPYPPSPKVAEAFDAIACEQFRLYSDPVSNELRDAAAAAFNVPNRDWVIAGNGSDDILTIAIRSFVNQGGTIAALDPSYSLYSVLADIQGAQTIAVPLTEDFSLPENILEKTRGADIFFLTRPNAPTGNACLLDQVTAICDGFEGVVFIDEAYADFARDNCLDFVAEYDNIIVSRTLSKSYSLAGLRIGFGVAHPHIIEGMMKVKDSYNLNRVSQTLGVAALRDVAYLQETSQRIVATREATRRRLIDRGFSVIPSETNFLFAQPPTTIGAKTLFKVLRNEGILVRYFGSSPKTQNFIRITVGTEEEMAQFTAAIDRILLI